MSTPNEASKKTLAIRDGVSALRNDVSALHNQVNQLSISLVPATSSEFKMQLPSLPDAAAGSPSLYARRLGFAKQIDVETAYQRDSADFIVKVKAALSDGLVPYHWDDEESIGRMKRFFSDADISLDLLETGDVQNDDFPSVARSDLVVRGEMLTRHIRAHSWIHKPFILYWTLLEICRYYGIF
ncbi:hypothetical protein V8C26DRAFT_340506 [Trichoderma gracile]